MRYGDVEDLVADDCIEGAVGRISGDEADATKWSSFLKAAAFAVDRQTTPQGRRLSLRQLAFDDEDRTIASEAREHALSHGTPPLHLSEGSSQPRVCTATVLTTHDRDVRHLALGSDGSVITASRDGLVRNIDVISGELVSTIDAGELRGLLHVGAGLIAVARTSGSVDVLDCCSGGIVERFDSSRRSGVSSMALLSGERIASGHLDGRVRIHSLGSRQTLESSHHCAPIRTMMPVAGGMFAVGDYDGLISVCGSDARPVALLRRHAHPIRALTSDDEVLCSGDDGGLTLVWRLEALSIQASNQGPYRGVHHLLLLQGGNIVIADFDGTLRSVDSLTGREVVRRRSHTSRVRALLQLSDGGILTASDDRTIRTWTSDGLRETSRRAGHLGWVRNAAELPDGRIITTSVDKTVRVWPAQSASINLSGHSGWIRALVDCGGFVASAAEDGTVRLWDTEEGHCLDASEASGSANRCLTTRGGRLVAGDDDGALIAWRITSSGMDDRRVLIGAHDRVRGVALLGNDLVVSAGSDGWLRVWDLSDLECVAASQDRNGGGWRTIVRINSTTVAAGNERGEIVLWCVDTSLTQKLTGHRGRIWTTAVIGPELILTVSFDRTARLWDLGTRAEIARVGAPLGASWGVTAVGDSLVAAASPIGVVRVARTDDLAIVARADLRSAAVSIAAAKRANGCWRLAVGGDDPKPLFLEMDEEMLLSEAQREAFRADR